MTETDRVSVPARLRRLRRLWRWAVPALAVAVLAALPSVARALPTGGDRLPAQELLARVRASGSVGWSGYGESRGGLVVPDVRELGDLPQLAGGTSRLRGWWRGPGDWRVDALSLAGETDVATDRSGAWTWVSTDVTATRLAGELPVRLPQAADLLAPVLGRRLAGTDGVRVTPLPARRVAGRTAQGLRLTPPDPTATTVRQVDLWADPGTGLPLRVELLAAGQTRPSLTALLLDLDLTRPPVDRTTFTPPGGASVTVEQAPDLAARIDQLAPYLLPQTLAGLRRTDRVDALRESSGVATYGSGFGTFALVPLPRDAGRTLLNRLSSTDGRIVTPLVNGLVARGDRRTYLLAGTVPADVLERALTELLRDPPPRRDGT
jgi:MucB/RseB N-terminal domain